MKGAVGNKTTAPAEGAELALSDNGKGIPSELEKNLFDPFITSKSSGGVQDLGYIMPKFSSKITMD